MNHDFKDMCSRKGSLKESINSAFSHIFEIPLTSWGLHWCKHNTSLCCDNQLIDCDTSISHMQEWE